MADHRPAAPEALPALLVLDLDGTLIASLPEIAAAVNALRTRHGLAPLPPEEVRDAIGHGATVLLRRVMADAYSPEEAEGLYPEFLVDYERAADESPEPWRPGAPELLDAARRRGIDLAILSNKPLALSERILRRAGALDRFVAVRGPENSPARKPDPVSLTDVIESTGHERDRTWFVGDSVVDFATGRAAGVFTVGLRGGYLAEGEPGPDLWLDDPAALHALLEGRNREAG